MKTIFADIEKRLLKEEEKEPAKQEQQKGNNDDKVAKDEKVDEKVLDVRKIAYFFSQRIKCRDFQSIK